MSPNHSPELPLYKPEKKSKVPPLSNELAWVAESVFIAFALLFYLMGQTTSWKPLLDNISINFLAIMVEALPFMLIGSLAGGIIEVFVSIERMERIFVRRKTHAVFLAGAMGLFFPVCECAIVPVVRRLLRKGVPFAPAVTFLLAGPIVNGIVAASTAVAYRYDWSFVIVRLACGYLVAVTVGLLLGLFFNRSNGLLPFGNLSSSCGCGHNYGAPDQSFFLRLRHSLEHASDDFFDVGRYLVIGAFIAAFMRSTVPMDSFVDFAESPWLVILLMMALAVLLNLCSEADAFIAASFRSLLPASGQMAFMVMGPMLDIKLILMYFSVFKRRVIVFLIISISLTVFLTMLALEYLMKGLVVLQ